MICYLKIICRPASEDRDGAQVRCHPRRPVHPDRRQRAGGGRRRADQVRRSSAGRRRPDPVERPQD